MRAMCLMTEIGIGLTLLAGGSSFFHAESILEMRKSVLRAPFSRGSWAPIARNVCATARK